MAKLKTHVKNAALVSIILMWRKENIHTQEKILHIILARNVEVFGAYAFENKNYID